jgi:hypothetical protein
MATELNKSVRRITRGFYRVLYAKPQRIVASLEPGDIIRFRAFGCRHTWDLPIDGAFRSAVRAKAIHDAAEKRKLRKAKK